MTTPRQKFQTLLREMLQTDKSDLDFGIYRVVNLRQKEMETLIEKTIPDALGRALEGAQTQNDAIQEKQKMEKFLRRQIGSNAFTADGQLRPEVAGGEYGEKWREVCARVKSARPLDDEEVCNRLISFFQRYYDAGDFISKRRHGPARFAVPYDGREVLLHWANRDQHYIKTADRFSQYAFHAKGLAVQFKVEKSPAQKDNNKPPAGHFILDEIRGENGRIVAVFHRREITDEEKSRIDQFDGDRQTKLIADAENRIRKQHPELKALLTAHAANGGKSVFAVHAARFVRRNTSDFFIHRNLRAFLRRELDFFLKNEMLDADDLAEQAPDQNKLAAFRAVRAVARKVIDILAQWEDFQKSLWEKKKFILQTEYCAALGSVPESGKSAILNAVVERDEQWAEWKTLGIQSESDDLFSPKGGRKARMEFLKRNPSLPIDTVNFPPEFKDELLAQFEDLDDATDGILIHGDNWQALNLLEETWRGRVKCVYIDPPYNTGPSEIIYKNDYKHSSWLSMMEGRVAASIPVLGENGVYVVAIDENEQEYLGVMLSALFPQRKKTCVTVVHNPSGQQGDNFSLCHENAYFIYPQGGRFVGMNKRDNADVRPLRDVSKGSHLREDAANCFYPILVRDGKVVGFGEVCDDSFHPDGANVERKDGTTEVYPIDAKGVERKWVFARQNVETIASELKAEFNKSRRIWDVIRTKTVFNHKTVWDDKKYSANSYGAKLLGNLGVGEFDFPKSIHTVMDCVDAALCGENNAHVLDYFAGSGTTAHAVMNLNREDGGRRKFILAEMGNYFNTVLLPRVKKIIYSPEWRAGKAVRPATATECERGPKLVKYIRLESYEDALDNVDFKADKVDEDADPELWKLDDFIPRYMLRWESRDNPTFLSDAGLESPFDYELRLSGEKTRKERVDLAETFAHLIGLRVRSRRVLFDGKRRYEALRGVCLSQGEKVETAVIWRDVSGWEEADYERDRDFIEQEKLADGASRIFVNHNSRVDGADILDPVFRGRMFSEEEAE